MRKIFNDEANVLVFLVLIFMFLSFIAGGAFGMIHLTKFGNQILGILGLIDFAAIAILYIKNGV